jgi:hypothetical protein
MTVNLSAVTELSKAYLHVRFQSPFLQSQVRFEQNLCCSNKPMSRRHNTQHNATQHNDTQHNNISHDDI